VQEKLLSGTQIPTKTTTRLQKTNYLKQELQLG